MYFSLFFSLLDSDDVTPKQNGSTSSFIPSTSSNDVNDDNSLVIGGTILPATVPLVIESTQLDNNDQLEIISSSQTKKTIEEDDNAVTIETTTTTTTTTTTEIEIDNTQAYELEPTGEKISSDNPITDTQAYELEPTTEIVSSNNQIAETQAYELESEQIVTDVVETKREEVHQVVMDGNTVIEQVTTTTTTTATTTITENENPVIQTLAYDLQPVNEENTTTTTTTTAVIENENLPSETLAYDLQPTTNEQMDINNTAPAVCADTQEYSLDEQIEESSPRPASETLEVVPVSKLVEQLKEVEDVLDATPSKQQVEVIIDQNVIKDVAAEEQMDTDQNGKRIEKNLLKSNISVFS